MKKFSYLLVVAMFMSACGQRAPRTAADAHDVHTPVQLGEVRRGVIAGSQEDLETRAGNMIHFEFDRHSLTPEATEILRRQAAWLQQFPRVNIIIEGHADNRGTRQYNLALGERRANAAMRFLIAQGVPASRITTVSYGKDRPIRLGNTEEDHAMNRRGVTLIVN